MPLGRLIWDLFNSSKFVDNDDYLPFGLTPGVGFWPIGEVQGLGVGSKAINFMLRLLWFYLQILQQ